MAWILFGVVIALIAAGAWWGSRTKPTNTNGDNQAAARKYGPGSWM